MPGNSSDGPVAISRAPRPSIDGEVSGDSGHSLGPTASVVSSLISSSKATDTHRTLASQPSIVKLTDGLGDDMLLPTEIEGKEPVEQLDILRGALEKTTRLKEGAINFLKMELTDTARMRVERELDQANNKIDAISKAIESISSSRRKPLGFRTRSPVVARRLQDIAHSRHQEDGGDDLRTAKQQVSTLFRALLSYARQPTTPLPVTIASSSVGPPPPSTEAELEQTRLETMNLLIAVLQRNIRVRFEISMYELITAVLPALADRMTTRTRATAYRLLRHSLVNCDSVERLMEHPLEWYIVKSLARESKHATEREQVVKLLRTIIEIGVERRAPHMSAGLGRVPLSEPIMRALIAVAEYPEDPLRQICCQTLVEILLIDVDLMARTGGTRVLLQCLAEGPTELAPIIATAFLYMIDGPKTRTYLHPGIDLEIALSGITDAYGKGVAHAERMRITAKVVAVILRTWSGLMYLCLNDMLAIRAMINTLRIPSLETREVILDMFFELLHIQMPDWYQTFVNGRRLTLYRRHRSMSHAQKEKEAPTKSAEKVRLADQYISLLTAILTKAGLLDALVSMLEEDALGSTLSRKATLLIGEILHITNKVLPLNLAAELQTLPRIFALAADYDNTDHRNVGTTALAAIDSFNRHRARMQPITMVQNPRQRANSVEDHVRRGQRQVEQVKIKLAMQMDDKTFQNSIIETQVTLIKDHTKWNYDALLDLIEGPLLNPKRLEEAIKVSKFVKRLMSFFYPFSRRFPDIKKTKANLKWIKLGCTLLTTLMANPDGVRYLMNEDELLPQIVKSFAQLDPLNGSNDPIFSKKRVEETLTSGYLEMLGTLSRSKDGLELLEKHKIFTAFYHMSELRSREDLIKGIIENLDYSIDGHPRIVLSKALTSSYKHIRLYATKHLGKLIQTSPTTSAWMLRLLLTQLYDPDRSVCELAVQFLEEACESQDILHIVVDMHPTLEHLGEIANSLLFRFMSTMVGFRYLSEVGFIEKEIELWLHERNFHYVIEVEVFLARELKFSVSDDIDDDNLNSEEALPPHFYGELAKTDLGCEVLREKGHFAEFAHFIRQHALESEDSEIIFKLKSVLWAVGNVATSEKGLRFLEEEEIIPEMHKIAMCSPILSIRGTCFFALSLVSSTSQGAETLDGYGWESTLSPLGFPTGLCMPTNIEKFVAIPLWDEPELDAKPKDLIPPTSQEELDVLTAIGNLSNTVIANAASRSLFRMKGKSEYRQAFSSVPLYCRVLHMASTRRYRLPVRRYIFEQLFDIQLDVSVVQALGSFSRSLIACDVAASDATPGPATLMERTNSQQGASVLDGRLVRGWRTGAESDSDLEDDENSNSARENVLQKEQHEGINSPLNLQPVRRVVGFDGVDQDDEEKKREAVRAAAREEEERMAVILRGRSHSIAGSMYRRSRARNGDQL